MGGRLGKRFGKKYETNANTRDDSRIGRREELESGSDGGDVDLVANTSAVLLDRVWEGSKAPHVCKARRIRDEGIRSCRRLDDIVEVPLRVHGDSLGVSGHLATER